MISVQDPQTPAGHLERCADGWWITDYQADPDMGPYRTAKDAADDLRALRRSEPFIRQVLAAGLAEIARIRSKLGLN